MTDNTTNVDVPDPELQKALRRLAEHTKVPEPDQEREARLLVAFDLARRSRRTAPGGYWWLAGLATAAALLIAVGLTPPRTGRHGAPSASPRQTRALPADPPGVRRPGDRVGEFVVWPGSAGLPPLESGELLRTELPLSMLPSLGLRPPVSHTATVRADVLVGQDGLARAVRLVD